MSAQPRSLSLLLGLRAAPSHRDSQGEMSDSSPFPKKTKSGVTKRRKTACWKTKQQTSITGRLNITVRKLVLVSEGHGSHRRLLSWAVVSSSELFFGKIPLAVVVGEGLVGVEGEEVR